MIIFITILFILLIGVMTIFTSSPKKQKTFNQKVNQIEFEKQNYEKQKRNFYSNYSDKILNKLEKDSLLNLSNKIKTTVDKVYD